MLHNKIVKILFIISLVLTSSCNDLLTTPPLDAIGDEQWWKTKEQVLMMVNDCYRELYGPAEITDRDCLTDNGKYRNGQIPAVGNGTHDTQNGFIKGCWEYANIAKLNYVLEGIEKSKSYISSDEYRQLSAQVRFIRAFVYYDMVFYFGDIPLITKTLSVSESRETSRQPRAEVMAFILNELEEGVLKDIIVAPSKESGRVNEDVVNAFLARIYLHEKNYDKVLQYTKAIIETNKYELYSNYEALFRPKSDGANKEVIFERQYSYPLYVHSVNRDLSPVSSVYGGWSQAHALQNLVDDYECINGHSFSDCEGLNCEYVDKRKALEAEKHRGEYDFRDPRLQATIMYPFWEWKVGGVVKSVYGVDDPQSKDYVKTETHMTGYLITKWVDLEGTNPDRTKAHKNMTIIRYADVLLMRAEALIEKNKDLNEAVILLNRIRERAGMPQNIVIADQSVLREKMRHERRIELAFEGLRYYDMIRWKIGDKVRKGKVYGARMKAVNEAMDHKFVEERFWDDKMYLFPIPQAAIDLNPNLTQNNGWK
ncbi:RagB/SusD family nutrient uptake outer membrane protein [Bacteroides neonati]|uniref:RagB/SusD family nutrient uptake outer membrane protein n=1 Tax=Bacteroides neonati TaxID=1347393 RepID=UPI0004AD7CA6|nr:RagB/SusD family nutrient uptake outer membrane protein [Bacteroides neonati]